MGIEDDLKNSKIVILDDDPINGLKCKLNLKSNGFNNVSLYQHRTNLILNIEGENPDVVICDTQLNEGHLGYKFIKSAIEYLEVNNVLVIGMSSKKHYKKNWESFGYSFIPKSDINNNPDALGNFVISKLEEKYTEAA
ncbi:MAG: response regulator [Nanoarchaeota archaeon]|nr:response regulator [Nanoarchaeota archaeon]